jgi:FtsZ-interacting cell division protein ZipA
VVEEDKNSQSINLIVPRFWASRKSRTSYGLLDSLSLSNRKRKREKKKREEKGRRKGEKKKREEKKEEEEHHVVFQFLGVLGLRETRTRSP